MTIQVSVREAQLLRAVQALFRRAEGGALASRLRVPRTDCPRHLSPAAMGVLQRTLSRGSVRALVRGGAWRERRSWVDGAAGRGRLWTLRPNLELRFTAASFALCRWVASPSASSPPAPRSVADALLYYLAADALRRAGLPFQQLGSSPLVALAFPETSASEIDWRTFVEQEDGRIVLESLQDELAEQWVAAERNKAEADAGKLIALGRAQASVLDGFLEAIDESDRRDLAGFLVRAGVSLVDRPARTWIAGLEAADTLSQRSEARRASAAFLDALGRLESWRREWAMVRFMDEGYDEAQLHLDAWDELGQAGFERASQLAESLHSLRELA